MTTKDYKNATTKLNEFVRWSRSERESRMTDEERFNQLFLDLHRNISDMAIANYLLNNLLI